MLSFFSKKKQNLETPTEDIIQGPTGTDDFIFVERKNDPTNPSSSMYPVVPSPAFGIPQLPYPGASFIGDGAVGISGMSGSNVNAPISYIQGVPFELAPQLRTKISFELIQLQVDGILALMTRQMSIDEQSEYNFTLERSVQSECY